MYKNIKEKVKFNLEPRTNQDPGDPKFAEDWGKRRKTQSEYNLKQIENNIIFVDLHMNHSLCLIFDNLKLHIIINKLFRSQHNN